MERKIIILSPILNYRYHLTLFPPTSQQLVLVSTIAQTFFSLLHNHIEETIFTPRRRGKGNVPRKTPRARTKLFKHQLVHLAARATKSFKECLKPHHPFLQQIPKPQETGHPFRANGPFQQPPRKKGLLGKLFGKSKQTQTPRNLFAPPSGVKQETRSSGGILETLKNPEGLNTMLNNTQRVLQAAEQFTPMIQQYGPIIKNLPSMWNTHACSSIQ